MQISGAADEIRFVLDRAIQQHAQFINFIPPNLVFIKHEQDGGYSYFRTSLVITSHMTMNQSGIDNLRKYMRVLWSRKLKRTKESDRIMLLDNLTIRPDELMVDYEEDFTYKMDTYLVALSTTSPLIDRVRSFSMSSLDLSFPYIKIGRKLVNKLGKSVRVLQGKKLTNDMIYAQTDRRTNKLYFKDKMPSLTLKRFDEPDEKEFDDDFFIKQDFANQSFYLSDADVFTMVRINKLFPVDNFYIMPFKDFYVIEAHGEVMRMKLHHKY